ncbi:MAG TPA: metallophosphoesterase [Gemmatimonadales bacterium]
MPRVTARVALDRLIGTMTNGQRTVRVAAVGDLHFGRVEQGVPLRPLFAEVSERADVLVLCGDLTDTGSPDEARALARVLSAVTIPIVAVLGNHDYESGKAGEVSKILCEAGVRMLDGEACEVEGIGFAGVKGFAGGFGRGTLGPWGEGIIKQFVQEALGEALKLETALGRLRSERRIAVLHYSPVESTVEGEPREIYPFLGCSRLEEPLTRYPVDAVFHGHAHHGAAEGTTKGQVPVYNVSLNLLQRVFPDALPFRVVELTLGT